MDRPLYFVEDRNVPEGYGVMPAHQQAPPFPTLQDYFIDHVARNDPDPREDLVHPFVD